jgi:hypothetical protein
MNDIDTQLRDTLGAVAERTRVTNRVEDVVQAPQRRSTGVALAAATFVGVILVVGIPTLLSQPQADPPSTAVPAQPSATSTTVAPATDAGLWVLLNAPKWTLVGADGDPGDDGSYQVRYTSARDGARNPDRVFLTVAADPGQLTEDLNHAVAGGPEYEGRVDGFGASWRSPTDELLIVDGRQMRLVSFTDHYHLALWTDESGVGVLVTADRANREQMLDLLTSVDIVTAEEWQDAVPRTSSSG